MSKSEPTPGDQELFSHCSKVVFYARELVRGHLESEAWMPKYRDFPSLGKFSSGFPSISHIGDGPPEYSRLFGWKKDILTPFVFPEIPGVDELLEYTRQHERLLDYLHGGGDKKWPDSFFDTMVSLVLTTILDRLIHLHGIDFDTGDFAEVYLEIERGLLDEELPIEIWVPAALTSFVTASRIASDLDLRPISDPLHLARVPATIFGGAAHECIVDGATHAVVLEGRVLLSNNRWLSRSPEIARQPPAEVSRFFSAVRLVTNLQTGWAQAFLRPLGWARSYKADLPCVEEAGLARRYPPWWDEGGWLQERRMITAEELEEIVAIYGLLELATGGLPLAVRRFDSAMLRSDPEDAVLDALIGLEAAVGSEGSEITHKLSLRVAALLGREEAGDDDQPAEIFRRMKRIYRYRSAIIHGDDPASKSKLRQADGEELPLGPLALEYLRRVILCLLREERWRDPGLIDRELLLRGLGVRADADGDERRTT